jgi:hypothetical protein
LAEIKAETIMSLSHNHYCQHCDQIFVCNAEPCLLAGKTLNLGNSRSKREISDISDIHDCEQAEKYRKALRFAMRDNNAGCRYGCVKLPCSHGAMLRYPRVGGAMPYAKETFENVNCIGYALQRHGLYDKPIRRLAEMFSSSIPSTHGVRSNLRFGDSETATVPTVQPNREIPANRNLVRTAHGFDAVANRETEPANRGAQAKHDIENCINRKCNYCNNLNIPDWFQGDINEWYGDK